MTAAKKALWILGTILACVFALFGALAIIAELYVLGLSLTVAGAAILFLCFRAEAFSGRLFRILSWVGFALYLIMGLWAMIVESWIAMGMFLAFAAALFFLGMRRSPEARAEAQIRRKTKASERLAAAEQARADAAQRARLASEERAQQEEKLRQQRAAEQAAWHAHVEQQKAEEARRAAYAGQGAASRQAPPREAPAGDPAPAYKTKEQLRDERRAAAKEQGVACCPRCGSTSLSVNKQGFGAGKAIFIGPLAGTIGMNKLKITCLNCGYKYKPGKGRQ